MKKFLMMFVMSFILFTCSYAELNIGDTFECKQNYNILKISTVGDYTQSQMRTILENYKNYPSTESYQVAFNNLITVFSDLGCNNYFFIGSRSSTSYFFVAYPDNCNLYFNYSDGHQRIYLDSVVDSIFYCINNNSSSQKNTVVSDGIDRICELYLQSFDCYYSTTKSIKFVEVDNKTICFNGDYYYQASTTPDTPSFEGLSDTQKATIINSVVNSDEFKNIVPEHYRNQFFIIKNEWTNRYKVYFYPKQYYLKGRVFEADETEAITQKSYKIIATDSENFLWGVWQSINPFDYYVFSGYFNEDYSFNSYFYEYKDSHEMNQEYFSYEDEPIVYSSKDIGFVIYDISTNETTEDTENSISSTILKDDYGNEIEIVIPTEEGSENITFWDSIVQKIVNGIKVIFVPDFSNSLDFFEKLKSKFNFLFEVKDLVSGMFNNLVYQTEPPSITIDLTTSNSKYNWGSNAIALDMSWYEPYKPSVDIFICAFCYGIFFWNLFRKLANIVSGVSGEGAQSSKEGSK